MEKRLKQWFLERPHSECQRFNEKDFEKMPALKGAMSKEEEAKHLADKSEARRAREEAKSTEAATPSATQTPIKIRKAVR